VIRYLPIRHHSPMCARAVLHTLETWQPDYICIEISAEAASLLSNVSDDKIKPPIALLMVQAQSIESACFLPLTEYSPEWVAIQYANKHDIEIDCIDLPQKHSMALTHLTAEEWKDLIDELIKVTHTHLSSSKSKPVKKKSTKKIIDPPLIEDLFAHLMPEISINTDPNILPIISSTDEKKFHQILADPLKYLAHICQYEDAEVFWEQLLEVHGQPESVFQALITLFEAMRNNIPDSIYQTFNPQHYWRLKLRESHMRLRIHHAQRTQYKRKGESAKIAVLCGAWHVSALQDRSTKIIKLDRALLKIVPKIKIESTWSPWSDERLSSLKGYSAGIPYPHWYRIVWRYPDTIKRTLFTCTWLADQLRIQGYEINSADIIACCEMAWALVHVRGYIAPGIQEIIESAWTLFTQGNDQACLMIADIMSIHAVGYVSADCLKHPLLKDFQTKCKRFRIKQNNEASRLRLDLRKKLHRDKSHFLHQLLLLNMQWAMKVKDEPTQKSYHQNNTQHKYVRGTFHEEWILTWTPLHMIPLMQACAWGESIQQAILFYQRHQLLQNDLNLAELNSKLNLIISAYCLDLVPDMINAIQTQMNYTQNLTEMLTALVHLINTIHYGQNNVQYDQNIHDLLYHLLQQLIPRVLIHIPKACHGIHIDVARKYLSLLTEFHQAMTRWNESPFIAQWHAMISEYCLNLHPLLSGQFIRFMLDEKASWLATVHSSTWYFGSIFKKTMNDIMAWLEGFLNQNAMYLMYDHELLSMFNDYLTGLSDDLFMEVMPLLRRTLSHLTANESEAIFQSIIELYQTDQKKQVSMFRVDDALYRNFKYTRHLLNFLFDQEILNESLCDTSSMTS
jgi:hypothetical protein